MKRVWFNINTGEFSNSWEKGSYGDDWVDAQVSSMDHIKEGCKLIEYCCPSDPSFELYSAMKIVTNPKLTSKK